MKLVLIICGLLMPAIQSLANYHPNVLGLEGSKSAREYIRRSVTHLDVDVSAAEIERLAMILQKEKALRTQISANSAESFLGTVLGLPKHSVWMVCGSLKYSLIAGGGAMLCATPKGLSYNFRASAGVSFYGPTGELLLVRYASNTSEDIAGVYTGMEYGVGWGSGFKYISANRNSDGSSLMMFGVLITSFHIDYSKVVFLLNSVQ